MKLRKMRNRAFVLWGDGFDEAMAVIFIIELRKVGIQVQIVGLRYPAMAGMYGVTLAPDLTLDEAQAKVEQICCLIVPYGTTGLPQMMLEPRIQKLLASIYQHHILVVINRHDFIAMTQADLLGFLPDYIVVSSEYKEMFVSAQQLAEMVNRGPRSRPKGEAIY